MSPTVDRIGGFVFYFVMFDLAEPPHVHVSTGAKRSESGDAKIWLETLSVANAGRLNGNQIRKALRIVKENQEKWLEIWRYHENQRR